MKRYSNKETVEIIKNQLPSLRYDERGFWVSDEPTDIIGTEFMDFGNDEIESPNGSVLIPISFFKLEQAND